MSEDLIHSKIELLQEQIDNLEKSGHFTEQEINSRSIPLKAHLSLLKNASQLYRTAKEAKIAADAMMKFFKCFDALESETILKYGMTKESYEEGKKIHEMCFQPLYLIPVIQPERLTPNHQEA
ncbi:hypothetical protein ACMDB5_12980 [Flavobacterium sp. W1B]|uniref:hypothetical protein n=1 Tax=Flavobacterium sp. W1B TaxID=3394146 RepID=UPI0039BC41F9